MKWVWLSKTRVNPRLALEERGPREGRRKTSRRAKEEERSRVHAAGVGMHVICVTQEHLISRANERRGVVILGLVEIRADGTLIFDVENLLQVGEDRRDAISGDGDLWHGGGAVGGVVARIEVVARRA